MKKTVIFALLMLTGTAGSYAQVTIGNDTYPAATLDVVATKTDGSTAEGVIAPRLTLTQLASADDKYEAAQTGAIVYVKDAIGTTTEKTAKVTAVGYYYFDGTVWQLVNGGTEWYAAGTANDAQADKTGSISRNGRVAIYNGDNPATASAMPSAPLSIINETTTDANDNLSMAAHSEGVIAPSLLLSKTRGTRAEQLPLNQGETMGSIQFGSTQGFLSQIIARYQGDGDTNESSLSFSTSGLNNNWMHIDSNGNIGIGDTSPASKLEVNGAITNTAALNAGTGSTIDFSKSNIAYTTNTTSSLILQNIKNGGFYTLIVFGGTTSVANITADGFSIRWSNDTGDALGSRLYTIRAISSSVLFIDVDLYTIQL